MKKIKTCCECDCEIKSKGKIKLWKGNVLDICYDCWIELMKG